MNNYYVTAMLAEQHRADLRREAEEHRLALTARPCRPRRARSRWTVRWWRRETLPNCQPEVAGA